MGEVDDYSMSFIPGLVESEFLYDYDDEVGDGLPKLFLIGITKRKVVFYQIARYYP